VRPPVCSPALRLVTFGVLRGPDAEFGRTRVSGAAASDGDTAITAGGTIAAAEATCRALSWGAARGSFQQDVAKSTTGTDYESGGQEFFGRASTARAELPVRDTLLSNPRRVLKRRWDVMLARCVGVRVLSVLCDVLEHHAGVLGGLRYERVGNVQMARRRCWRRCGATNGVRHLSPWSRAH
jgi:hypothetical protein